jgi:hypothetical protein
MVPVNKSNMGCSMASTMITNSTALKATTEVITGFAERMPIEILH